MILVQRVCVRKLRRFQTAKFPETVREPYLLLRTVVLQLVVVRKLHMSQGTPIKSRKTEHVSVHVSDDDAAPDVCWFMQVSFQDLIDDILGRIFTIVYTVAPDVGSFRSVCRNMRNIGNRAWQRWLEDCKDKLTDIAGCYGVNVQIIAALLSIMDILQTHNGASARAKMSGHLKNLRTSADKAVTDVLIGDAMILIRLQDALVNGLDLGDILISNREYPLDLPPVYPLTLCFWVSSYEEAEIAQGLLLLMGEARTPLQHLDVNTCNAVMEVQGELKNRPKKPNVDIHLFDALSWNDLPPAFENTPAANMTSPGAWQTLANVFQELEIGHGIGPVSLSHFKPAGPTVFGTLRVFWHNG